MIPTSNQHRSRTRFRRVTALSLAAGGVLAAGASLLTVSFADTVPTAPPPPRTNPNCTLAVPPDPLSAKGLATAYTLTASDPAQGPCHESNARQSAFVQATVLDPATGAVSVYNPLVVDKGTEPAAAPVVPVLPPKAVVGIWFGFNGNTLTLAGQSAAAKCTAKIGEGRPFGQFADCNAGAFFTAADTARRTGKLTVPPLGVARDGKPCLTNRDLSLVDPGHAGNVTAEYLMTAQGRTAQKNAKNTAALAGARPVRGAAAPLNAIDNLLLVNFEDPALGCTPWTVPDLADPGRKTTALALNELQAAAFRTEWTGLVRLEDTMSEGSGKSARRRSDDHQAERKNPWDDAGFRNAVCMNRAAMVSQRIWLDKPLTAVAASPLPGQSLFDYLTQRLNASRAALGCRGAVPAPTPSPSATPRPTMPPSATPKPTTMPSATPTSPAK